MPGTGDCRQIEMLVCRNGAASQAEQGKDIGNSLEKAKISEQEIEEIKQYKTLLDNVKYEEENDSIHSEMNMDYKAYSASHMGGNAGPRFLTGSDLQ